ncbi:hypothetical protein C1N32_04025 [Vibrio diazotrophicus]|uniref:Uncharacterized protein n=1 Tax=Vibrio diazotrophicus TaxID=685 RepID=A0A2J8I6M1_VIBDI|nr:terminase family protein [Vibrio diazotrophicus]PNI06175.1 hypothetical protein C1N32_04025 [Vibrio diazotrophicus]
MDKDSAGLYFGGKALADALLTKEDQIFLTSTLKDSERIQNHIASIANPLGLSLTGNPFVLPNGARLIFLNVNSKASGGFSGNAYVINCFDESNFSYISRLVASWTMFKQHKATFISID